MQHISVDILAEICLRCDLQRISHLKQTCKDLFKSLQSDVLWKRLLARDHPRCQAQSFYSLYKQLTKPIPVYICEVRDDPEDRIRHYELCATLEDAIKYACHLLLTLCYDMLVRYIPDEWYYSNLSEEFTISVSSSKKLSDIKDGKEKDIFVEKLLEHAVKRFLKFKSCSVGSRTSSTIVFNIKMDFILNHHHRLARSALLSSQA